MKISPNKWYTEDVLYPGILNLICECMLSKGSMLSPSNMAPFKSSRTLGPFHFLMCLMMRILRNCIWIHIHGLGYWSLVLFALILCLCNISRSRIIYSNGFFFYFPRQRISHNIAWSLTAYRHWLSSNLDLEDPSKDVVNQRVSSYHQSEIIFIFRSRFV